MSKRWMIYGIFSLFGLGCGSDDLRQDEPWRLRDLDERVPAPTNNQPEPVDNNKPDPIEPTDDLDMRFVGQWQVHDNVPRGGITSDFYMFHADGRLELIEQYTPAGVVWQCAQSRDCAQGQIETQCSFGSRWWSRGPFKLFIEGECTDGQARAIELAFPEKTSDDPRLPGIEVSLISVDNDTSGWSAASFAGPARSFFFIDCAEAMCPVWL